MRKKLFEIAKKGNSFARYIIVNALWFKNLKNQKNEIAILKAWAEDNEYGVIDSLVHLLSIKGQKFLEESLEIIKIILEKESVYRRLEIDYYVSALCRNQTDECIKTLKKWIETEKVDEVFSYRTKELVKYLKSHNG
jgi:hypothetical protein